MTAVAIARHLSLDGVARRIPATLRFALCFLVLAGLLATMIGQRALILRDGREVRLTIVPVDPRDLFRGDYVVLTYDISEIRLDRVAGDKEFAGGDDVHVTLRAGADVVMRGRVLYAGRYGRTAGGRADCADTCSLIGVAYGIESYFVPEGQGRAIETTEKSRLEIVAAVGRSGEAAIKRLLLDGEMLYAEPLY